ncbi:DivIVA domain-containing protein [Leucobacter sp. CSA2]|uniref:Cell wall synthesis protein Wag31 n=1 Tax=Leucobacter edaphi TaxID=2796472 RepID=A0A934QA89_9MICO|nr:DivIVA domain-containing protein [Leucobacter edaphi]MBK0421035.1 DivIVA domain-containing protein [Leucobacter edaphi]
MSRSSQQGPKRTGQNGAVQTSFPLATGSQLGYDQEQVDQFLEAARTTYDGAAPEAGDRMTSEDVRRMAFPVKRGGYSARYVDAAMDRLEEVFFERERRERVRSDGEDAWWEETRQLLSEVRGRMRRPRGQRFRKRGLFATGYRRSQVDAFLDRISGMFERREIEIQPSEVRDVVFHSQWRGYDEDQVDALLDAVVEMILATR